MSLIGSIYLVIIVAINVLSRVMDLHLIMFRKYLYFGFMMAIFEKYVIFVNGNQTPNSALLSPVILESNGFYTIVGSNGIRPKTNYTVAVTSHGYKEDITVLVGIKSNNNNKRPAFNIAQNVQVGPWSTKTIDFKVGEIAAGNYQLYSKSIKNTEPFNQQVDLQFLFKQYSVYIQSDKPEYQPGDLIQFRVIVLGPDLKPFYPKEFIKINIRDAANNLIKQFSNVTLVKGVYRNQLQLGRYPTVGVWNIEFESGDTSETKMVTVEKSVLPKFWMKISTARHVKFGDGKIAATITAKHTYGQYVKGTLTVNVFEADLVDDYEISGQSLLARNYTDFIGQKSVTFTYSDIFGKAAMYERDIIVQAIVTEKLTNKVVEGDSVVSIHEHPYKISITGDYYFFPNMLYTAKVQVSYWNDTPVRDTVNQVQISIENKGDAWWHLWGIIEPAVTTQPLYSEKFNISLDRNGLAILSFIPKINYVQLDVSATYKEISLNWFSITKGANDANEYIGVTIKTPQPLVNKPLEIHVAGTHSFNYVTYQVVTRGNIVLANTVKSLNKLGIIKFTPTILMAPIATVFVYYVSNWGKFVYGSTQLVLAAVLPNTIKVSTSKSVAEPGASIDITVQTKPNSYCGLLGVDESVLLQNNRHDLNKLDILHGLNEFNGNPTYDSPYFGFDQIATVVITNVKPESIDNSLRESQIAPLAAAQPLLQAEPPGATTKFSSVSGIKQPRMETATVFLFEDIPNVIDAKNQGVTKITIPAPDTISNWLITGFTLDDENGLGLTDTPTTFTTFLSFFIRLDLPFSVISGEIIEIKINVFNYRSASTTAVVSFANSNNEFTWEEGNDGTRNKNDTLRTKTVSVPENDGVHVSFLISPHTVGVVPLKIKATSLRGSDFIEQPLLVVAEGATKYTNRGYLIDLRLKSTVTVNVESEFPAEFVPETRQLTVSCVGDILGSAIKNLNNLIQKPSGTSGERNLLALIPNIGIIGYLQRIGKLTSDVESRAKSYMETGYQNQLGFLHPDGTFSQFGPDSNDNGSTWLTAFTIRALIQASKFIKIDSKVVDKGITALIAGQSSDGGYIEYGNIEHMEMRGGSDNDYGLTAYMLLVLLESPAYARRYKKQLDLTVQYMIEILDYTLDLYPLAVTAYALQLLKHPKRNTILDQLYERGISKKNGMMFWDKDLTLDEWFWNEDFPNSVNIEITAYAVLALSEANRLSEALPALHWLVAQQNGHGGFSSTQDTVMGIEALCKLATEMYTRNQSISITITAESFKTLIAINESNAFVLQQVDIDPETKNLEIKSVGRGIGVCSITHKFNIYGNGLPPKFNLYAAVEETSSLWYMYLYIAVIYISDPAENDFQSKMALLSITLPTCFEADTDHLTSLVGTNNIARWETRNDDTVIDLYMDYVDDTGVSFSLAAFSVCQVTSAKPVPITIVDCYDKNKGADIFYEPRAAAA